MQEVALMQKWSLWIWLRENDGFAPWCQEVPSSNDFLHDRTGSAILTRERGEEMLHVDPG